MQATEINVIFYLVVKNDVTMNASGFKIKNTKCEKFSELKSIADLSLKTI